MNNNFDQHDVFIQGELHKRNRLQKELLNEKQAMRKAYCKVNNIPYEEPEQIPGLSQGALYVLTCTVWLIIVATIVCAFIGEGNFLTNFMKVWF
ncbi:hypothetical protein H3018_gp45 [Bacillus phage DK3]|uniref:Uncharacterized protein n=1 Tax=Bacillus phage DK3 TaxID=2500810 RepID=A0A3T0IJ86_9CAUD|nr:hypothetical protein H3018_gp45 [Bacillus phage DK3]AZU99843.1 hypothetical protein DK3_000045 [Bacillus phage DK3]